MANIQQNNTNSTPLLDTLAQLRKVPLVNDKQKLLRKARSKYFTVKLALPLADLKNAREKYYRNAYYCSHVITQENNKLTARYCNTRVCNICNRIRTAKLINGYGVQLRNIDSYFVTLTIPNVTDNELSNTLERMIKAFRTIQDRLRKNKVKLKGIRKLEITYNSVTDTYHPHYHIIIDGQQQAEILKTEWLKAFTEAQSWCQDIRKADESSVVELFKYVTKVVTKTQGQINLYVSAIDTIIEALYKRRAIQPFGDIKMVTEDVTELNSELYEGISEYDFIEWVYTPEIYDWTNKYGEILTGYKPTEMFEKVNIVRKTKNGSELQRK
jgi:hypothetical protein